MLTLEGASRGRGGGLVRFVRAGPLTGV